MTPETLQNPSGRCSRNATTRYGTNGCWTLSAMPGGVCLVRPFQELTLELDDVTLDRAQSLFRQLTAGCSEHDLLSHLAVFDPTSEPIQVLQSMEELGVLRALPAEPPNPPFTIWGDPEFTTRLHAALNIVPIRRSLDLFACPAGFALEAAPQLPENSAAITCVGCALIAVRGGPKGCLACAILRALGRMGRMTPAQRSDIFSENSICEGAYWELLLELEREPLNPGGALWLEEASKVARGPVLPHPDCPAQHPAPTRSGATIQRLLSEGHRSWESVEDWLQYLVTSPFGPVRLRVEEASARRWFGDSPFVWGDTCLTRQWEGQRGSITLVGIVHGNGATREESVRLALVESLERLTAQGARPDLRLDSTSEAARSTQSTYHWWPESLCPPVADYCTGWDLLRNQECLVPWERVAVALPPELREFAGSEPELAFTGAAAHRTLAEAILHASLECITRDAFMVMWYRRRQLPSLRLPPSVPEPCAALLAYLSEQGFSCDLFDLTLDLPLPLILLHLRAERERGNWPAGGSLLVPAGGFTPWESLRHALKLACSRAFSLTGDAVPELDPTNEAEVQQLTLETPFWSHLARYLNPRHSGALAFLRPRAYRALVDLAQPSAVSVADRLEWLRIQLRERGLNWAVVRTTDASAALLRVETVKVALPQLLRLPMTHRQVESDSARFALDLPDAALDGLNPDPHPIY